MTTCTIHLSDDLTREDRQWLYELLSCGLPEKVRLICFDDEKVEKISNG